MIEAERTHNELDRLCALHSYNILDTSPSPEFDSLVQIATRLLKVPKGFISLVDVERQWFKARIGSDDEESPRNISFCAHAILRPHEALIVPDARLDPRFKDHPHVGQPDGICFYAGAPLVNAQGMPLGSLCVVDSKPRVLTEAEINDLYMLARHVVAQLELHRSLSRAEETLRLEQRAAREYEEAAKLKSAFYATLSHEIRAPLTSIIGYAELLQDKFGPSADGRDFTNTIHSSSLHLLNVVNDLLDLSKAEAGKLSVEMRTIDVSSFLNDLSNFAAPQCKKKLIEFKCFASDRCPAEITSDPTRVRQILYNLLSNAIKFTSQGEVCLEVSVTTQMVLLHVRDTGLGLTEEQQSRVFEPFEQADDTTTRKYGGTGLGLTICKKLAEALGGYLEVASEVGVGSVFTLGIPRSLTIQTPETNDNECRSSVVPNKKTRILIADDAAENRQLLTYFLEKENLTVIAVENGQQAVEKASYEPFNLILMDLNMPVLDGARATEKLRQAGVTVPILALTGATSECELVSFSNAGCTDAISKPFKREALIKKIFHYLKIEEDKCASLEEDEEMKSIIMSFLSKIPGRLEDLERHLQQQSWQKLAQAAHILAGSGLFGFMELGHKAQVLEGAAQKATTDLAADALIELRSEAQIAMTSYKQ